MWPLNTSSQREFLSTALTCSQAHGLLSTVQLAHCVDTPLARTWLLVNTACIIQMQMQGLECLPMDLIQAIPMAILVVYSWYLFAVSASPNMMLDIFHKITNQQTLWQFTYSYFLHAVATVSFSAATYTIEENGGMISISIIRSGDTERLAAVLVATEIFQGSASGTGFSITWYSVAKKTPVILCLWSIVLGRTTQVFLPWVLSALAVLLELPMPLINTRDVHVLRVHAST